MGKYHYLYFPGCKLSPFLADYDRDTRAVLAALDVSLEEGEFNCCGYPIRDNDFTAAMYSAARVLAFAAQRGLPLLTPCKCCYGNLKQANYWILSSSGMRRRINTLLAEEGLRWHDNQKVAHLLTVLDQDIGSERIAAAVRRPLVGLKVAPHYGCHALRPGDVTQFDNPLAPTIFERVIAATGAQYVTWPLRLECCGRPLWKKNDRLASSLTYRKQIDAKDAGARILVTACTHCQLQFNQVCRPHPEQKTTDGELTAVTVSRLLTAAFGLTGCMLEEEVVSLIEDSHPLKQQSTAESGR